MRMGDRGVRPCPFINLKTGLKFIRKKLKRRTGELGGPILRVPAFLNCGEAERKVTMA